MSEEQQRPRDQQQQQDDVEAHGVPKGAANVEQGDEAAGDDEVEAHSHIRKGIPKNG